MSEKWQALRDHAVTVARRPILSLFEAPGRAQAFSVDAGDMRLDY